VAFGSNECPHQSSCSLLPTMSVLFIVIVVAVVVIVVKFVDCCCHCVSRHTLDVRRGVVIDHDACVVSGFSGFFLMVLWSPCV